MCPHWYTDKILWISLVSRVKTDSQIAFVHQEAIPWEPLPPLTLIYSLSNFSIRLREGLRIKEKEG